MEESGIDTFKSKQNQNTFISVAVFHLGFTYNLLGSYIGLGQRAITAHSACLPNSDQLYSTADTVFEDHLMVHLITTSTRLYLHQ